MRGEVGIQGNAGPKGDDGIQGPKGSNGVRGMQGNKGNDGARGVQGVRGPKGDTGPRGIRDAQDVEEPEVRRKLGRLSIMEKEVENMKLVYEQSHPSGKKHQLIEPLIKATISKDRLSASFTEVYPSME